jgi:6-phosphogluconolactonase
VVDADPAARAAEHLAQVVLGAQRDVALAFSGGKSPWRMVETLAKYPLPWPRVSAWQVDERVAPDFDDARNYTHLFARLPVPARFVPVPIDAKADKTGAKAAARYAAMLQGPATRGVLDLVHLGLGDDGHTASLFPGDPALKLRDVDVAAVGPHLGHRRVTLTLPAICRARELVFLVSGASKREPLRKLLAGDVSIPAGRIRHPRCVVYADPEAAP